MIDAADYSMNAKPLAKELNRWDIAICGGGPAGSVAACYLADAGLRVVLFEQDEFPRHQIGESLLPESLRILDEIGFGEQLRAQGFVKKFGARFYSERLGVEKRFAFADSLNPASAHAYQVPREVFDQQLLNFVRSKGVTIMQPVKVVDTDFNGDGVTINGEYHTEFIIWANGIGNRQLAAERYFDNASDDNATGLYAYFPCDLREAGEVGGDILVDLFYPDPGEREPSWAWAIPLSESEMSVGFVLRSKQFAALKGATESIDAFAGRLLAMTPKIAHSLSGAEPSVPFRMRHNFQRVAKSLVGPRQAFCGDAAGFIDPVFSSGVHLALQSAKQLAEALSESWHLPPLQMNRSLLAYEQKYQRLFWIYYRFVKMFYQKNLVEHLFLMASGDAEDEFLHKLTQEFTSILAGDVMSPNSILDKLERVNLAINPEIASFFAPESPMEAT